MVVLVVENLLEGERGEITRWLIEAKAGVFVGNASSEVREKLWERVQNSKSDNASALLVYKDNTEQGYSMKMSGNPRRYIVDFEGLSFVGTNTNVDK